MKKKIKDYENYWVYDNGDVYNETTKKILAGSIGENGYKYYRLSKDGKKKMYYAHRLVAETYLDNPQNLPVVNHKDGDKLNNNVENLEWVSYSENTAHWHNTEKIERKQTEYYENDLENEIWKKYGKYLISSCGRVRNSEKNNLLSPTITCGYYKVRLSEKGLAEDWLVHKLVYMVFSDDKDLDGFVIDHIDGNKLNNNLNNLRKLTLSENVKAALYETKTNSSAKPVQQFDLSGNFIAEFVSAREASRVLGLDSSTISKVCRGQNKTHGGFIFKYKE